MHRAILLPRSPCSSPARAARRVAAPIRARRISPSRCSANTTAIKDFSADFVHTYRGGVLKKEVDGAGAPAGQEARQDALAIHRARAEAVRVRWREAVFVHPAGQAGDRHVHARPTTRPPRRRCSWPARATSSRDFSASIVEPPAGAPAGTRALKLVPRSRNGTTTGWCSRSTPADAPAPRPGHVRRAGRDYRAFLSPT